MVVEVIVYIFFLVECVEVFVFWCWFYFFVGYFYCDGFFEEVFDVYLGFDEGFFEFDFFFINDFCGYFYYLFMFGG